MDDDGIRTDWTIWSWNYYRVYTRISLGNIMGTVTDVMMHVLVAVTVWYRGLFGGRIYHHYYHPEHGMH